MSEDPFAPRSFGKESSVKRRCSEVLELWLTGFEQFTSRPASQETDFDDALAVIMRVAGQATQVFSHSAEVEKAWATCVNIADSTRVRVRLTKAERERTIIAALQVFKAFLMLALFEVPQE
jgi:hypothetical protein